MLLIYYNLINRINVGTEEAPVWEESKGYAVELSYSEANLEIAKAEAWNGEVVIEDDGQSEPEQDQTQEERIAELEESLDLLLSGVTE